MMNGGGRQADIENSTERERQTDRQTDRGRRGETDRQTGAQRGRKLFLAPTSFPTQIICNSHLIPGL